MPAVIGQNGEVDLMRAASVRDGGPVYTDLSGLSGLVPVLSGFWGSKPVSYAELFATQTWVAVAVTRLLTWSVRVPLKVYQRSGDGSRTRLRPGDDPLAAAIAAPWVQGTQAGLVTHLLGSTLVHGNGLMAIDDGVPGGGMAFRPLDWRTVMPIRLDDNPWTPISGWRVVGDHGSRETLSADKVVHLRWWSPLGQCGISPLQQLGVTIQADKLAQRWAAASVMNTARPSGIVELSDKFLGLDRDERQALLTETTQTLRSAFAGGENAGKLAVLPPGISWADAPASSGANAVEAQLVEQRRLNREEVAAVFQIPPPMIGILDRATYANLREAREMGITDGLAPPLILMEQTLNAVVCRGLLRRDDVFVEFDFAGILRGDRLKEIEALREAIGTGLMTPNEGRDTLNMPRIQAAGADEAYLPRNNLQPMSLPMEEVVA